MYSLHALPRIKALATLYHMLEPQDHESENVVFFLNELHLEFHYNVGILAGVYKDTEKLVNWSPIGGNVK